MFLSKESSCNDIKREAIRYQPSFDLRKNIAKIVAYHSPAAVQKGIVLDIFVSPETPNYFQGNVSCFLVMLSQLLKHGIESLKQGDLSIRIYHDSLHQNNSCDTEISIIITTHDPTECRNTTAGAQCSGLISFADRQISLNGHDSLHRVKELCRYFDGNFTLQRTSDHMTQYIVTCILQQTHPAGIFNLA